MIISWLSLPGARQYLSASRFAHLADNSSLTRRVRQSCCGQFEVKLIDHKLVRPGTQERELLKLPRATQALSRQVFLCCDQVPRVFARTIIGLTEENRPLTDRISSLGEQSLGSVLFRDPLAVKRQMHLTCLPSDHVFFDQAGIAAMCQEKDVWVRRSLFNYKGCDLIVYEAFIAFPENALSAG